MNHVFAKIKAQEIEQMIFSDIVGYKLGNVALYSIQENYLDVIDLKFFMLNEVKEGYQ